MNKRIIVVCIFLVVFVFFSVVVSASTSSDLRDCRRDVSLSFRDAIRECNSVYRDARFLCVDSKRDCRDEVKEVKNSCYDDCSLLDESGEERSCRRECSMNYTRDVRACSLSYRDCRENLSSQKNECRMFAKANMSYGRALCLHGFEEDDSMYRFSQSECVDGGGLFQQLCKGPYFGIVCTQDVYCQCGGASNYTCPVDSTCNEDHNIKIRGRGHSLPGFRTLLGEDLGAVGICERDALNVTA